VYNQVAKILRCPVDNLEKQVESNFFSIFRI
jgi:hypothetical protein